MARMIPRYDGPVDAQSWLLRLAPSAFYPARDLFHC
jgi:hypothetical protein